MVDLEGTSKLPFLHSSDVRQMLRVVLECLFNPSSTSRQSLLYRPL